MSSGNGVMMQLFEWYTPADGSHWNTVARRARELAGAGITAVWLPPAYKGSAGANDVGYGVYDLYDLGQFDQKGTVRTKYGTRDHYLAAIQACKAAGLEVYADVVLNHRDGADETEKVRAYPFTPDSRNKRAGDLVDVEVWTKFTFPGRKGKYSDFQWNAKHFDAVNYASNRTDGTGTIYLLEGHTFDDAVDPELGNFDFLLGCDLDVQNEEVRNECRNWIHWYIRETGIDGIRLDAVKHISAWAFRNVVRKLGMVDGRSLFVVGEYWSDDSAKLKVYLHAIEGGMSLFDVPLHMNFHRASKSGGRFDMRTIFDRSLAKDAPTFAVTFVDNHDSQPLQALESVVDPWFKPLAYAMILLREHGYPCVFLADYDGAKYHDKGIGIELPAHRFLIDRFLAARRSHAWGEQLDYLDHEDVIGWTRLGNAEHPGALAVVLSDGPASSKHMDVRRPNARFIDITGHIKTPVTTGPDGKGHFPCNGGSVSVWTQQL